MIKQPTSLNIDSTLWKEVKIEAIRRGVTLTELVEYALRKELHGETTKIESKPPTIPTQSSDKTSNHSKTGSITQTISTQSDSNSNNIPRTQIIDLTRKPDTGISNAISSLASGLKYTPIISLASGLKDTPIISLASGLKDTPIISLASGLKDTPIIYPADLGKSLSSGINNAISSLASSLNANPIPRIDLTRKPDTGISNAISSLASSLNANPIPRIDLTRKPDTQNPDLVIKTIDTFKNQLTATISGTTFHTNQSHDIDSVKKRR